MTPPRVRLALPLALLLLLPAPAAEARGGLREELRDGWDLFLAERRIENGMALGHVRGLLARRPAAPDWTPRTSGKGRLELGPGGVPIMTLEGTPEEMGRQHGELLRGEVRALRSYVEAFLGRRKLREARKDAERLFLAHSPPDHVAELRALAEAAGLDARDVFLAQSFTDLYRGFACSTLGGDSPEGPFLARNLDFPTMGYLHEYSLVVVARPEGKRPFVSVSWPGLVGVLSGQSDALALSVLVVHDAAGARAGVPFQLAFRRVLEEAGDAAEAEALLRETPLTVTNNLMVVDRAGAARVLELSPERIVAREPDAGGRLVATNHFVSRELRQTRASLTYASSRQRFDAVRESCPDGSGPVPLEDARQALKAAATPVTAQSMVFLPAIGAIEVAFTARPPATRERFVRLSAADLLGE